MVSHVGVGQSRFGTAEPVGERRAGAVVWGVGTPHREIKRRARQIRCHVWGDEEFQVCDVDMVESVVSGSVVEGEVDTVFIRESPFCDE